MRLYMDGCYYLSADWSSIITRPAAASFESSHFNATTSVITATTTAAAATADAAADIHQFLLPVHHLLLLSPSPTAAAAVGIAVSVSSCRLFISMQHPSGAVWHAVKHNESFGVVWHERGPDPGSPGFLPPTTTVVPRRNIQDGRQTRRHNGR